jgi:hypothetical protein
MIGGALIRVDKIVHEKKQARLLAEQQRLQELKTLVEKIHRAKRRRRIRDMINSALSRVDTNIREKEQVRLLAEQQRLQEFQRL